MGIISCLCVYVDEKDVLTSVHGNEIWVWDVQTR